MHVRLHIFLDSSRNNNNHDDDDDEADEIDTDIRSKMAAVSYFRSVVIRVRRRQIVGVVRRAAAARPTRWSCDARSCSETPDRSTAKYRYVDVNKTRVPADAVICPRIAENSFRWQKCDIIAKSTIIIRSTGNV